MKKILKLEIIAEIEIDTDYYPNDIDDQGIINIEKEHWHEWILDENVNMIKEFLSIKDKKERNAYGG